MATVILALSAAAPGFAASAADAADPSTLHEFLDLPGSIRLSGSLRVRQEILDGQYRAGFDRYDDLLSVRTTLLAEWRQGPWRVGIEIFDSRAYDTSPGSVLSSSEVNALEPVQAYVAYDFRNPFGEGSSATLQAGRFTMNIRSRRLIAADDYRNTTNGYTGVRADLTSASRSSLTLYYTLPQERRPADFAALRRNDIQLDRESSAQRLWGLLAASPLPGKLIGEIGYVGFDEEDSPGRPTRDRALHSVTARLMRDPAPDYWDFEIEAIHQSGSISASQAASAARIDVSARFLHADVGYSFSSRWRPRLSAELDYASGDSPGSSWRRFDTLFGSRRSELAPSGIYGAIGRSNLLAAGLRLELTPSRRLDAMATWHALWAPEPTDSFSTSGLRDASGGAGRFAGHQFDTRLRYWLIPQTLRAEFNGALLLKGGPLRRAPNAPPHGNTVYLSASLQMNF